MWVHFVVLQQDDTVRKLLDTHDASRKPYYISFTQPPETGARSVTVEVAGVTMFWMLADERPTSCKSD
jgi:hypothetical protein